MILRAIFWIGLVSLLMPREPDLGFGRPGAAVPSAPTSMEELIQSTSGVSTGGVQSVQDACAAHKDACAGTLSILNGFQSFAVRSLDQVRADLETDRTKTTR
jgi:hypothetical protein